MLSGYLFHGLKNSIAAVPVHLHSLETAGTSLVAGWTCKSHL